MNARKPRRSRRDRHHAASHSGKQDPPPPIPDHPAVPGGEPIIVTSDADMPAMVEHIRKTGQFAFDTEFIGEETYVPKLCLLQLATRERLFLVDPLTVQDLEPIWSMMADPDLETLVHAGDQDLEPVERLIGRCPANIIDTQIAAGFIGQPYPLSLTRTVKVMTGYEVTKGMTFTKWDERPLSDMQNRYAADDVRYLPLVWERMKERLEENGQLAWCIDQCNRSCRMGAFDIDVQQVCRKFHRRNQLRRAQWYRLCHLVTMRNELARKQDVPPRKLIPDGSLSDLARRRIENVDELNGIKGLPRPTVQRHGFEIMSAIAENEETDRWPDLPVKLREESAEDRVRIDSLWTALSCWCLSNEIAPALVTSRSEIAEWVLSGAVDEGVAGLWPQAWKQESAGSFLSRFLSGDIELSMEWKENRLQQSADD